MPLFSNLNLNGSTPPRARPTLGEWGPDQIVGTRTKKRRRWITVGVFFLVLLMVAALEWYVWHMMTGRIGFGFD